MPWRWLDIYITSRVVISYLLQDESIFQAHMLRPGNYGFVTEYNAYMFLGWRTRDKDGVYMTKLGVYRYT